MSIVAKFGGSSVKDTEAIKRCCKIIQENEKICLMVISATYNTTNELEIIAGLSIKDISKATSALDILFKKHKDMSNELGTLEISHLGLKTLQEEAVQTLYKLKKAEKIEPALMDEIYSYGERLSTLIISDYLRILIPSRNPFLLDIRPLLITNGDFGFAEPQLESMSKKFSKSQDIFKDKLIITQGFIGSTAEGKTTTLGREGSDYSATLIAEMIDASEVQIWTDVEGVATVDPKQVKSARFIDYMTYEEAGYMALNGAKILFPKTLQPAKRKNIPVYVRSSLNSAHKGTKIHIDMDNKPRVTGLAIENGILTIVGNELTAFKIEIDNFLKEFGAKQIENDSSFIKYTFRNNSTLHVALYSLHAFLFAE